MKADGSKISVVAFTDDGAAREVLLDDAQRLAVKMLLMQMFIGRKIPVSSTELPMEPICSEPHGEPAKRKRNRTNAATAGRK